MQCKWLESILMCLTQQKLKWNKQWQLHHQDQPSQDMLHELLCKRHIQHYHKKCLQKYLHTLLYREWFREEETLTLFRMDLLAGHRKTIMSHMSFSDETWHSYIFSKEDPQIHKPRDAPIGFSRHQHFFTENQQLLLYQEIQI